MVDEPSDLESEADEDLVDERETDKRHPLTGVVITVVLIVLIVLAFLLLRGCGSTDTNSGTSGGGKVIVSVPGLSPQRGAVSVWVAEGANIDGILAAASIRTGDVVNMGGGRYVITVPEGTEAGVVRRLMKVDGVADAGRVYTSDDGR